MRLKRLAGGLALGLCIAAGAAAGWQVKPSLAAPDASAVAPQEFEARTQAAEAAIRKLIAMAKAPQVYAELRTSLETVIIPALKESAAGTFPGSGRAAPDDLREVAKGLTFLDYLRHAAAEFEAVMNRYGDEMIREASEIVASEPTGQTLLDLQTIAELDATAKVFDTIHAMTRLATGLDLTDARAFAAFEAWLQQFDFNADVLDFNLPQKPRNMPTPERLAKAQKLVTDALTISRIEDMGDRVMTFARDVYAKSNHLSEGERQQLLQQLETFEFSYNMQKAVALSLAPVLVSSMLTDEQMDTIHAFVRSPAFGKAAGLYYDVIRAGTSFTLEDMRRADKFLDGFRGKDGESENDLAPEWQAYVDKWKAILREAISPEVRAGLERSWAELTGDETRL